jgi:N-formylglutamate amidohydrolase
MAVVGRLRRDLAARIAVPSVWHRLRKRCHGGIVRAGPVNDRGQCTWRHERKWCQKANVPFHLAFTFRDLVERLNAARYEIVDPSARLGYGEENGVPGFWLKRIAKELPMFARCSIALAWLILAPLLNPPARAADEAPADLVQVRQGTLPIILTVPHGGREAIPGVAPRNTRGRPSGGRGYVTVTDTNTDRLAEGIAAEIKALTGKDVYLVTAKFERKFADPNRPPEIGLDSPAARPYYDYYHQSVRRFIDEIRRKYPAGLLIDVHGQKKDPTVLMRGTRNGHSVERLLERAGVAAVTGPNGMFGQLEAHGFKIYPANDVPPGGTSENGGYSGGYTVGTYGSHDPNGIDAVQMEFGSRYRQNATVDKAAREAGKAIAAFYASYLKTAPN